MIAQLDREYIAARPWKLWARLISYGLFEGRPLTTRGRWINPLVFGLYALEKRLPRLRPVEKPVFIVGTGRSGTTILGVILSLHRQVGFLNEPKALWHSLFPGEDIIGNYGNGAARYRLGASDATATTNDAAQRIYGAYLAATCSRRVVDKYPELIFRAPFVRAIFPDAKFIFLVRNGWDTCHSISGWSKDHRVVEQDAHQDWWGLNDRKWNLLVSEVVSDDRDLKHGLKEIAGFTSHVDRAAVEWIVTMRAGMELMRRMPECVCMVRYEDLVAKPEDTLNTIMNFCELPSDPAMIVYALKSLAPVASKAPLKLNPLIKDAFADAMREMRYA